MQINCVTYDNHSDFVLSVSKKYEEKQLQLVCINTSNSNSDIFYFYIQPALWLLYLFQNFGMFFIFHICTSVLCEPR